MSALTLAQEDYFAHDTQPISSVPYVGPSVRCAEQDCPFPAKFTVYDQWGSQQYCTFHETVLQSGKSREDRAHPCTFKDGKVDGARINRLPRTRTFQSLAHSSQLVQAGRLLAQGASVAEVLRQTGVSRAVVDRLSRADRIKEERERRAQELGSERFRNRMRTEIESAARARAIEVYGTDLAEWQQVAQHEKRLLRQISVAQTARNIVVIAKRQRLKEALEKRRQQRRQSVISQLFEGTPHPASFAFEKSIHEVFKPGCQYTPSLVACLADVGLGTARKYLNVLKEKHC